MRFAALTALALAVAACHAAKSPQLDGGPPSDGTAGEHPPGDGPAADGPTGDHPAGDGPVSDGLDADVDTVVGRACISSQVCGATAWCNPASNSCQLRGAPHVSFTKDVNPIFQNDSCQDCHDTLGNRVLGLSGVPLTFSQSDPLRSWSALVVDGTDCSDQLSRRVCVDDPRKSLLALFPLRIPGERPFNSTQIVVAFQSWGDTDLQKILEWIAEGAPYDGPDGGAGETPGTGGAGGSRDGGPGGGAGGSGGGSADAGDAAPPTDAPVADAGPEVMPPPPLGSVAPLVFAGATGCWAEQVSWQPATANAALASQVTYSACYSTSQTDCTSATGGTCQMVTGTTSTVLRLPGAGSYCGVVRGSDPAGDKASQAMGAFTIARIPPDPPGMLSVASSTNSPTTLTVTWTAPPSGGCTPVAGYQVCFATTMTGCGQGAASTWTTAASTTTGTTTMLTGLSPSTTYTVFVRSVAQDATNTGAPVSATQTTSMAPDTTPPGVVTNVTFATVSSSCHAVTVNWPAPLDDRSASGQISYDVCYSTSSTGCASGNGASHQKAAAGITTATVTGLNVGTAYFFTVRSRQCCTRT